MIAHELRALLCVWTAEEIPVLLTKGFAMAEFEYPEASQRYYGDVDVVLPDDPAIVTRAVHLALAHGWRTDEHYADPGRWTHETAHLFSPSGHVRLDVHRFVISWTSGPQRHIRQITRSVWQESAVQEWRGLPVRRPSPVDQAVVTLILARTWGGDAGGLKAADYTDLQQLRTNHGLTVQALTDRADAFRARHTVRAFLRVCDPWRGAFTLGEPTARRTLLRGPLLDGRFTLGDVWMTRLCALPDRAAQMNRVFPHVRAGLQDARRGDSPGSTPHVRHASSPLRHAERLSLEAAGRWLTRLHRPWRPLGALHRERAYVTFRILREAGDDVDLVLGQSPQTGQTRVWIEDRHGIPDWYGDPRPTRNFREVKRWSSRPAHPDPHHP
ncbi:hypothetical protein GCM10008939_21360 [Deinococcus aquiradiocola]|uniref:Uncharacterized protein n=1 Tax=Deinococcus aquiradiocola TaxID=393059 RepID=A0A917PGF9_9DEIO|nr:hypothetical protein GCM10008939_21360 [Deinococcus aquiradiocola]